LTRRAVSTTVLVLAVVAIIVIAGAAYFFLGAPTTPQGPTLKMAAILPGQDNDGDYNTLGAQAIQKIKADKGIEATYAASVAVPDAGTQMEQFIGSGYNIIWAHGAQFNTAIGLNTTQQGLAAKYPNVTFIAETDAPVPGQRSNVWIIDRNFAIGYYAIGAAAALASKTGKIAYIGGLQLPFSNAEANAAIIAARSINPNIQIYRFWSGDFNDPQKANIQAQSIINQGVDVIMSSTNLGVYGILQAVNNTNVLVTTKYTDKTSYAPNNYITSYRYDFGVALEYVYDQVKSGVTSGYYVIPFGTGCYIDLPLKNVSSAANTQVSSIIDKLKSGAITVSFNASDPGPGP